MENTSLYESWCMSLIKIHRSQHTDTSLKQSYRVNDRSLTKHVTPLTLSESTLKLRKESDTVTMELCKSPDYSSLQIGNRRGEGNPNLPLSLSSRLSRLGCMRPAKWGGSCGRCMCVYVRCHYPRGVTSALTRAPPPSNHPLGHVTRIS